MAYLILPHRYRNRAPLGSALLSLRANEAIARGMVGGLVAGPGFGRDLLNDALAKRYGTSGSGILYHRAKDGYQIGAGVNNNAWYVNTGTLTGGTALSYFMLGNISNGTGTAYFGAGFQISPGVTTIFSCGAGASGAVRGRYLNGPTLQTYGSDSSSNVPQSSASDPVPVTYAGTYGGGATGALRFFYNGVQDVGNFSAATQVPNSSAGCLIGPYEVGKGRLTLLFGWNRELSVEEVRELNRYPWHLIRGETSRRYVDFGAVAGPSNGDANITLASHTVSSSGTVASESVNANATITLGALSTSATATVTGTAVSVVAHIDGGNVEPADVVITDAYSSEPIIYVDVYSSAWRNVAFGLSGANGKRPIFRVARASSVQPSNVGGTECRPVFTYNTTDYTSWVQAPSRTLVGGTSGYIEFQFTDAFNQDEPFIALQPMGRVGDYTSWVNDLLTNYASVASPTGGANSSGVIATSPAENGYTGRGAVGSNPIYAVRLDWGGSTNDGGPKRVLGLVTHSHAMGESISWITTRYLIDWMMNSPDAKAVAFRQNWIVNIYGPHTPNGLKGGNPRTNFRTSQDPNRDFDSTPVLAETSAIIAAIATDKTALGRLDAVIATHGSYIISQTAQGFFLYGDANPVTRSPIAQSMITAINSYTGQTFSVSETNEAGTIMQWARDTHNSTLCAAFEYPNFGTTALSDAQTTAQAWGKAIADTDAAGLFWNEANASINLDGVTVSAAGTVSNVSGGFANITLAGATTSAIGTVAVQGAASPNLAAVSTTAAGAVSVQGAASSNLAAITTSAAGVVAVQGAASPTLDAVTVSSSVGSIDPRTAEASITLGGMTSSAAGSVAVQADAALTTQGVSVGATGAVAVQVAAAITLADATVIASSGAVSIAQASISLAGATAAGAGTVQVAADAAIGLTGMQVSGAGAVQVVASAAVPLAGLTTLADTDVEVSAQGNLTLAGMTVSASTGSELPARSADAAITLAGQTVSAAGQVGVAGQAAIGLAGVSAQADVDVSIIANVVVNQAGMQVFSYVSGPRKRRVVVVT